MEVQTTHQQGVVPREFPMKSLNQSVIKHKTGLLNLAAELGNISKACRIMGFSRDTFYRYQAARDAGGVEALFEVSRGKPNLKNRVEEATEQAVVEFATAFGNVQNFSHIEWLNRLDASLSRVHQKFSC